MHELNINKTWFESNYENKIQFDHLYMKEW